jgi:3-hydroxyisobutyrate dehydrogenase-like beta-hydroxyacid dehydrogenase
VDQYGGRAAPRRARLRRAEFVFACVGNDDDLRSVVLGDDGAFAGMGRARSSSTTPPPRPRWRASCMPRPWRAAWTSSTRRCRAARPARSTAAHVMCGGDAAPFEAMKPVAMAYARAVT